MTSAACRAAGVPCGEALELLCRGYDEPRILARALMLAAKLRQGFRPRSATAWLRDKVARGHGDIGLHETAKRMLGSSAPLLPLNWIEPQTRGAPVPTPVGELLRRAAGGA